MSEIEQKVCDTCHRVYSKEADFLHKTSQWRVCTEGNLWFNCSCNSTLMLQKGKFSWYNPGQFLSPSTKSVFNNLATVKDFPHIPSVIIQLQGKIMDEGVDAKALANLVRVDPFLAAKILDIASNLKNLRALDRVKLRSLEHSIAYVGRKTLSELLVVASISSFKLKTKLFTMEIAWQPAVYTAVLAEALAARFNKTLRADEVYLAGCLCNIGKVVSAISFPEQTDAIYKRTLNKVSWRECEAEYEDIDHCILGEIGASIWGLPQYVGESARLHHEIPKNKQIGKDQATITEIVAFANLLTPWFCKTIPYSNDAEIALMAKYFGLDERELDNVVHDLQEIKIAF